MREPREIDPLEFLKEQHVLVKAIRVTTLVSFMNNVNNQVRIRHRI